MIHKRTRSRNQRREFDAVLDDEQAEIVRDYVGEKKFARMTERGKVRKWNAILCEFGLLPDPGPRVFIDMRFLLEAELKAKTADEDWPPKD
jgi:hypothetical protein